MKIRSLADLPLEAVHGGAARKRVLIRHGEASSPLVYLNEAYLPPGAEAAAPLLLRHQPAIMAGSVWNRVA